MGRTRLGYLKSKKKWYSRKLAKSMRQKIDIGGANIVNRMYQVNGNNRIFRDRTKSAQNKYRAALAKQLYKEISKPNALNFTVANGSYNNENIFIFNTDSYFTYEDFKINKLFEDKVIARHNRFSFGETYDRYTKNMSAMLPDAASTEVLQANLVANSVLNPAFYPKHIIVNPTVACINWGWIFRINPSILRFDYSMFAFYHLLLTKVDWEHYCRFAPVISQGGRVNNILDDQALLQRFQTDRRYRMIVAQQYFKSLTATKATEKGYARPVFIDHLEASNLQLSVILERITEMHKSFFLLAQDANGRYPAADIQNLPYQVLNVAIAGVGQVDVDVRKRAYTAALNVNLVPIEYPNNAAGNYQRDLDKYWTAIFMHSSDSIYFLILLLDMYAYYMSTGRDFATPSQPIVGVYMQANKYISGKGLDNPMADQYCYVYSDMIANDLIKVYPCNMMVGKDWKIKSRKANSLVFYVPNNDVRQTVNFVISINCSLYSFKKFILETADSRRYEALSSDLKEYIKRMLPNVEKYFIVKDANAKIMRDKVERMLNTINRI